MDEVINNMHNGFHYEIPNRNMPVVVFLILFALIFIVVFYVMLTVEKNDYTRSSFLFIIFFSVIFRLILLPGVLIHENDIYRYLWDGKVLASGMNPYKFAPEDVESYATTNPHTTTLVEVELKHLNKLRRQNLSYFNKIGHREVPTIYPPFVQIVFAISSIIKKDSILLMKTIFVIFDILILFLISKMLLYFGKNPALCIIYGWSPLVLKEIANSGHYDSIPIFFMLLSIYFIYLKKNFLSTFYLVLASLSKFFPVTLLLLFIKRFKFKHFLLFFLIIITVYIPFFLLNQTGVQKVFEGLLTYSEKWAYNGSIFTIIYSVISYISPERLNHLFLSKIFSGIIFLLALIYISLKKSSGELVLLHKVFVVLALLFLLSPVANPWYFCWVIPFLCFFPYRSFLVLSGTLIFSYLSFSREVPGLILIQYLPFFALLFLEGWRHFKRKKNILYA